MPAASTTQLERDVLALALPGGRMVGTPGHEQARRYVVDRMTGIGLRPFDGRSFELPYEVGGQGFCNLVGVAPCEDTAADPTTAPVLIGAHYDSVIAAPCADDNAAGVSIALAAAQELVGRPAARSVIVAIFDAEEPPYYLGPSMGSIRFYEDQRNGRAISAAVIMDLVGHDVPGPVPGALFVTGAESHPQLAETVEATAGRVEHLPTVAALNRYIGDVSDHHVFRVNDVPYLFLSCGRWEHYHMPTDTPDRLNYDKMARILAYLVHVVREMCDRELTTARPTDTVELEIGLVERAFGPAGLKTREDLDRFAGALLSTGL